MGDREAFCEIFYNIIWYFRIKNRNKKIKTKNNNKKQIKVKTMVLQGQGCQKEASTPTAQCHLPPLKCLRALFRSNDACLRVGRGG